MIWTDGRKKNTTQRQRSACVEGENLLGRKVDWMVVDVGRRGMKRENTYVIYEKGKKKRSMDEISALDKTGLYRLNVGLLVTTK